MSKRGAPHDRRTSALLCRTDPAPGPAQPAATLVAAPRDAPAATARRVPADAAIVRHCAQGRDALAHAVVADGAAARRRRARDPGGRRPDLESEDRSRRPFLAIGDPAR